MCDGVNQCGGNGEDEKYCYNEGEIYCIFHVVNNIPLFNKIIETGNKKSADSKFSK